jgi:hypothetical protein
MKKTLLVFLGIVFLLFSSISFAQDFSAVKQDKSTQTGISEKQARETMDKLADDSKEKLATFMKQEKKSYASFAYANAKHALEVVDKFGRDKVLIDKSYIKVSGTVTPTYILVVPQ